LGRPGRLQSGLAVEVAETGADLGQVVLAARFRALLQPGETGGDGAGLSGLAARDHLLDVAQRVLVGTRRLRDRHPQGVHLAAVALVLGGERGGEGGGLRGPPQAEREATLLVAKLGAAKGEAAS